MKTSICGETFLFSKDESMSMGKHLDLFLEHWPALAGTIILSIGVVLYSLPVVGVAIAILGLHFLKELV